MKQLAIIAVLAGFIQVFVGCKVVSTNFHPDKKYSSDKVRSDLVLLKNILEANHPSLYWYTPKDSVDAYFAIAHAALNDSTTEKAFKNQVAWVISKIRCGHTVARHSKEYSRYFSNRQSPIFPLSIKVWPDTAVIVGNLHVKDSILKRGTIVTGINNFSIKYIIDSIFQLMSTDGYADNFKYQVVSFNFPAYYRNAFDLDSQYIIHYIDSTGKKNHKVINNFYPKKDTSTLPGLTPPFKMKRRERKELSMLSRRNMVVDTALNTAFLSINTFSEGRLSSFFRRSFRRIRKDSIDNIVLDLRLNSGGNVLSSTKLSQYLVDKPFKIADTVAAISRKFKYRQHIQPWFLYWLSMHFTGRKMNDGRIHFRYFEKHYFKPKKRNHFDGKIYVLTGGFTFSAATLVTSSLVNQKNVTVLGEETGGGAYGNSAMHLPVITLPNTRIRVTLPLYRLVIDSSRPKNGRGIMPDIEVGPSTYYIKHGVDVKMKKVRELIKSSSNQ